MRGVHRLTTLDPDGPDAELEPLGRLVGDAELVGLGESVHTSGGFYRAKHRVFAYLVRRHGFRALAIESNWEAADDVGRYLATGDGDPAEVVGRGLYPVWACAETVELVRWMRRWNVEHPDDPLALFGFDVQQPEADRAALTKLLRERADARADGLADGLTGCAVPTGNRPVTMTRAGHDACLAHLAALDAWLDTSLGDDELALARLRVVGLRAAALMLFHSTTPGHVEGGRPDAVNGVQPREDGMAQALRVLRERRAPGRKTAVWAHNGHLAHATHRCGLRGYWMGTIRGMGTLLREDMGEHYRAVALTGHRVATRWPGQGVVPNDEPHRRPGSLDRRLHELGDEHLIVDPVLAEPPRRLFGGARKEWFGRPEQVRVVVRDQFAAVLYLDRSPAMTPLR